jgi:small conductance mechanosensitive channel
MYFNNNFIMKKIKSLVLLYFLQVIFYSPISFAATAIWSKELEQTNANVGIIYSIFSKELLLNLVFVVIVIIWTFSLSKIVNARLVNYFEKMAEWNEENNREELIWVLTRVANITLITIWTSIILSILWIDVWIFMWWIWFGLWFTLKIFLTNFIAWVLMVSQWFYHNGDFIEILWKMWRIKKINALFTSIEQLDGIIFFVPNVKFLEENVENYNTNNKRRVDVPVWVDYDTDIVKAKTIMINILWNFPSIMKAPEPVVMVTNFWDSSIDLSLRFWIDSKTGKYFEVKSNVMETVNLAFKKAWIVIPFPQVTLNNRNGFELNMQK